MKVFDLDGTLLDSNGVWRTIDEEFVGRRGCVLTQEYNDYVAHAIFPDAARFTKQYYHLDESEEEIMASWLDQAWQAYSAELPLKPGAKAYLEQCRRQGERLALFTSSEPRLCRAALTHHGILDAFDGLYFAQMLQMEKKYTESFVRLSALLGEPVEECILYDDSPVACRSAKAAGWQVVGIRDPFFSHLEAELRANCHRCIDGFPDLL
ncbi:MAG: HAD-IA family hydrolase [Oscillospiraceae bacterium]|nr:HAD-IA family hydrolase [Oscillospiraceae bacterium]